MYEKSSPMFSTRDIYLSATLLTLGFPFLNISYQIEGIRPRPIGFFEFKVTPELREAKQKYHQGFILVEPKALFASLQNLKSQVMNAFTTPDSEFHQSNNTY